MATFKVVVQKQRNDGFYAVYIRVTHNRGVKYLRTDKIVDAKASTRRTKRLKTLLFFKPVLIKLPILQKC